VPLTLPSSVRSSVVKRTGEPLNSGGCGKAEAAGLRSGTGVLTIIQQSSFTWFPSGFSPPERAQFNGVTSRPHLPGFLDFAIT
jgi:hypothetical protein